MFETRLRAILDTAVDGIMLIDSAGLVSLFNPACERMFGYAAAEVVGRNVKMLMPAPYHAEHDGYLANYHRTGEKKIIGIGREVVGLRKGGGTFPLDLSVGEATYDGKRFYVGILRDVTDRARAEILREALIEQLTSTNEELGHFAHVASHDLREPLRMITGFCSLLRDQYGERLDERGREYMTLVYSATRQMQELLDDLVDYARIENELEHASWFEAGEAVNLVLETLAEPIAVSRAEITVSELPRLHGNAVRFNRLMQNLIGNALKYVEEGVEPRVHVSAVWEPPSWRFCVTDNGIGIEARHFERIFEPFKRLHSKERYYGTGLGLAICRKIVKGFGGDIWVTSEAGCGSAFVFTINTEAAAAQPVAGEDFVAEAEPPAPNAE